MRTGRLIIFMALILGFSACAKRVTTVTPGHEVENLSQRGMIYSLPATILKTSVTAEHNMYVPGPYAAYAQKYLGIQNVLQQETNQWSIISFSIAEDYVADINALFVVEPVKDAYLNYLSLTNHGLVIPVGQARFSQESTPLSQPTFIEKKVLYTDLAHTPFIGQQRTTHYTRSFQDSTFVRVPVHRDVVVEKSLESKAKEAADFIFLLRKRRLELLSGDADFIGEGSAVRDVLDEISRLEEEYLSLFIGKSYTTQKEHLFDYFPQADDNSATILFRFSKTKGVLPASDLSGSPVLIGISSVTGWNNIDVLDKLLEEKGNQKRETFYYRVPQPAKVRISDANGELYIKTVNVYQLSPLLRVPSDFGVR